MTAFFVPQQSIPCTPVLPALDSRTASKPCKHRFVYQQTRHCLLKRTSSERSIAERAAGNITSRCPQPDSGDAGTRDERGLPVMKLLLAAALPSLNDNPFMPLRTPAVAPLAVCAGFPLLLILTHRRGCGWARRLSEKPAVISKCCSSSCRLKTPQHLARV